MLREVASNKTCKQTEHSKLKIRNQLYSILEQLGKAMQIALLPSLWLSMNNKTSFKIKKRP